MSVASSKGTSLGYASSRRTFLAGTASLIAVGRLLAEVGLPKGRLGICSFSCHRQWETVRTKEAATKFQDGASFYEYGRSIGADGVQTSVGMHSEDECAALRKRVVETNGYFEGDIRIPRKAEELDNFERDVVSTKSAGAEVARSFLSGSRRYETWKTRAEFTAYLRESELRLAMIEPILKKHRLKLAIENHKDFTADELVELLKQFDSPWLGVNVDTGNNIALLEDPYEAIEKLAPLALSVHLKDMAIQAAEPPNFLLSEIACGDGMLDLKRICRTLLSSNPNLVFNLEMATRDPLKVPYLSHDYWQTFGPTRNETKIAALETLIRNNLPKKSPPSITGKLLAEQLAEEEHNNRTSLEWMHAQLEVRA